MGTESRPKSDYTRTWFPSGEIEYATLADGTRLRYVKAGSGPALILLHTVRTQLDHFQLVIPKLVHAFTVFAIDMPGMGWSDITPGASYAEPALRRATVEFVKTLDLDDVTLAGESMGATVSLTASTELEVRVRRILAFNTYDYPEGVSRANRAASSLASCFAPAIRGTARPTTVYAAQRKPVASGRGASGLAGRPPGGSSSLYALGATSLGASAWNKAASSSICPRPTPSSPMPPPYIGRRSAAQRA